MAWPNKCAVVIPCLNEERQIGWVVAQARQHLPTVLVVDDGSQDDSAQVAAAAGAEVVRHPVNLCKGAALNTGLSAARRAGFVHAITMDGDGQHRPEDIPCLLNRAEQTQAPLVIGNRMAQPQAIPWVRRQANRWLSHQLSRRAGRTLPDTQCGFRLLDLAAWSRLPLKTCHFEVESETLMAFIAAGHRVEFVPIQVVGRGPQSHIRPLTDALRWWKWWRGSR